MPSEPAAVLSHVNILATAYGKKPFTIPFDSGSERAAESACAR